VWRLHTSSEFTPEDAATLEGLCSVGAAALARVDRTERLRTEAGTDALTQLPTRRQGMDLIRPLMKLADRHGQSLSVAMLDLDHFKNLNDRFGHMIGDAVLRHVGAILAENFRSEDVAVRWGGEEFVLALFGANRASAVERLQQVLDEVQRSVIVDPEALARVTFSAGVAEHRRDAMNLDQLLEAADAALYAAKAAGRACIRAADAISPSVDLALPRAA
jgi:diguanylate cyclase (GGDEF)-like protein